MPARKSRQFSSGVLRGTEVPGKIRQGELEAHLSLVARMAEYKPAGAEHKRTGAFSFAVLSVADQRASEIGHLYSDLVMAPGIELDLQKRRCPAAFAVCLRKPVVEPGGPGSGSLGCADSRGVRASVFDKIIHEICFRRRRDPADYGKIVLPETGRGELTVQFPCGSRSLGKDQQPFHGLVEAVDDREIGGLPGRGGLPASGSALLCEMVFLKC